MLQPRSLCWAVQSRAFPTCHGFLQAAGGATAVKRSYATAANVAVADTQNKGLTTSLGPQGVQAVLRTYKPRTPGLRHLRRPIADHLWKGRPFKPLTIPKKGMGKAGRNCTGQITVRHRGGGHKRRIRIIDYVRSTPGPHVVERIERDPNRSAHIALLTEMETGRKSYIIAAEGMRAGDVVQSFRAGIPQDILDSMGGVIDPGILASKTAWRGNCLPLHMVPVGTTVFAIGDTAKGGAIFCRSAGTYGVVQSRGGAASKTVSADTGIEPSRTTEQQQAEATVPMSKKKSRILNDFVQVRIQSGEVRRIHKNACCTIGVASNIHANKAQLGKAGRSRWLGIRPTVRGVAMNKVDHPHGGGRGKSKSNHIPVSQSGVLAKSGYKTRPKRKKSPWVVVPRPRIYGRKNKATVKVRR